MDELMDGWMDGWMDKWITRLVRDKVTIYLKSVVYANRQQQRKFWI
jgi:hypothetical protein